MDKNRQALSVLIVSTLALTVCFMAWMMWDVIGRPMLLAVALSVDVLALCGWQHRAEEGEVHVFDVKSGQFVPASSATHSSTSPYRDSPVFNEIDESYRPQQA